MKVKFGEVVKDVKLNVDRANNPYEFYVAGDHMDSEDFRIHRKGRFATDDVGPAFVRIFKSGQVLYGSRRTYLKKVCVADFEGVTANTTFVLETKDEKVLLQKLLPFLMVSDGFTNWSVKHSKGSTNPYVLFSDLADYEFSLPPLERQRELAELLWAANDLKEKYKALIAATDEMLKAKFREMFGGQEKYPLMTIGEMSILVTKGTTPTSIGFQFEDNGVMFVKAENITDDGKFIKDEMMHISDACHEKLKRSQLQEGDYLFSIAGVIGRTAIVGADILPCNTNQAISLIRLRDISDVDRKFFYEMLRSPFVVDQCENRQKQTAQANISLEDVKGLRIPLPPLSLQRSFVAIAEKAEGVKAGLKKSIAEVDAVIKGLVNSDVNR